MLVGQPKVECTGSLEGCAHYTGQPIAIIRRASSVEDSYYAEVMPQVGTRLLEPTVEHCSLPNSFIMSLHGQANDVHKFQACSVRHTR